MRFERHRRKKKGGEGACDDVMEMEGEKKAEMSVDVARGVK